MCVAMCCSVLQCVAVWRGTFVYAIWLVPMCDVSHLNMRHSLFTCVTWHIIRDMACAYVCCSVWWNVWCNVLQCVATVAVCCSVTWHICIYEMACADVWRVAFEYEAFFIYVWRGTLYAIWLVHMCVAVCDKKCVAVFCSVKWHICIYEMACADVWRVWFVHMCVAVCDNMCVAVCCSVLLCEVTHLYMRHGLCRCVWRVAFD